ncbi:MAG TPA: hypothetical protein VE130_14775 [Nitrososphaeraceae archaeon]|nr:hypothetical protein [Nitrososphaeraceae archaeon]
MDNQGESEGIFITNDLALLQNVNRYRISQIWSHYQNAKIIPIGGKPGRPSRIATNEEISLSFQCSRG